MNEFKTSLDLKSKIITSIVGLLFAFITLYNFQLVRINEDATTTIILLSTTILVIGIFVFCYLFRPLTYNVTEDKIIIRRLVNDRVIELRDIRDAFLPTKESMRWTIRTFGNGGVFGYTGSFRNTTYGGMTWYATRTSNYLMIITHENDKIVLTPDDLKMLDEIRSHIFQNNTTFAG